jgi:hypothetical protein
MNVVDIGAARLARTKQPIDPEIASRLCEVDPTKLLSYLANVLPFTDLEWQALFVLDRAQWLRTAAEILLSKADHLELGS